MGEAGSTRRGGMRPGSGRPGPTDPAPVRGEGSARADGTGTIRAAGALIVVALLLPLVLLALASRHDHVEVVREAESRVERTLRVLQEHAVKVFETRKLILDRVTGRLRGMDWESEPQRADLHAFLDTGVDLIVEPFTAASLGRKVRSVLTAA